MIGIVSETHEYLAVKRGIKPDVVARIMEACGRFKFEIESVCDLLDPGVDLEGMS